MQQQEEEDGCPRPQLALLLQEWSLQEELSARRVDAGLTPARMMAQRLQLAQAHVARAPWMPQPAKAASHIPHSMQQLQQQRWSLASVQPAGARPTIDLTNDAAAHAKPLPAPQQQAPQQQCAGCAESSERAGRLRLPCGCVPASSRVWNLLQAQARSPGMIQRWKPACGERQKRTLRRRQLQLHQLSLEPRPLQLLQHAPGRDNPPLSATRKRKSGLEPTQSPSWAWLSGCLASGAIAPSAKPPSCSMPPLRPRKTAPARCTSQRRGRDHVCRSAWRAHAVLSCSAAR